jgi:glycosyltransferase involved in cell wall biosynthesis
MAGKVMAVVVPCFNEEAVLPETHSRLMALLDEMIKDKKVDDKSFILFVNDGSRDKTWEMIEQFHLTDGSRVGGVKLAGNVGHQNALMAGLHVAKEHADIIVTIDADLQDDISVISQMVDEYDKGSDIVYGVRKSRKSDTWFKRNTALSFYKLMRWLGVKSVYNHADYRLMSRRAVEQLCHYRERNLFLRGMVPLIGYRSAVVYYDRAERFAGESKYPLKKMINFAVDGITSFSVKPVRLVLSMGLLFVLIALIILIYVIISYLDGVTTQGWSSLMISIWFVGGAVLIGLGIVGEYVGKIYIEVKDRPLYNIEKII